MATFATVQVYKYLSYNSIVYTEEGLHRCVPIGSNVSGIQSPVLDSWKDVTPRPGQEMSEMELPTPGLTATATYDPLTSDPFNFIVCKLATMRGNVQYVYGWVDSVRVKVDKGENRSIIVRWHVDWWHTMGDYGVSSIMYGRGRLLRGPSSYARPDPTQPRLWVPDSANATYSIGATKYYICVKYIYNTGGTPNYTQMKMIFWQLDTQIGGDNTPATWMVYQGLIEELFSLDPDSIVGAWLSPISPVDALQAVTVVTGTYGGVTYAAYKVDMGFIPNVFTYTYGTRKVDDSHRVYIVDPYGAVVANVPWGMQVSKVSMCVDFGGTDARVIINFDDSGDPASDGVRGCVTAVPLISIPITSNAFASYVYSGQREYDQTIRAIQRDQQAVNGIAGIGTSAIGGAIAGSMVAPGPGTIAGAVGGIISSAVGTTVSYAASGHFDNKTQEAVDKLSANQAANIINTADGQSWQSSISPGTWQVVTLKRDDVSEAEMTSEQSEIGYLTDLYNGCHSILMTLLGGTYIYKTGGFRIEGLEIHNISKEARDYISGLFARGVHID